MPTLLDLSDAENVRDARVELDRAGDDTAALAVWAAKWGDAALNQAEATTERAPLAAKVLL
ncbi:hypothetical protein [Phenylobacterium sp.]|uniref:hypothetical protein n=1 Tax=Phenylobacterium sp. TaxID=1871053 RepID=UPI0027274CE1|nr:hypothetical protein [Phenylobacterium sp.]MDO8800073.1 hypothetical protein [Phenylobacterium sp.]